MVTFDIPLWLSVSYHSNYGVISLHCIVFEITLAIVRKLPILLTRPVFGALWWSHWNFIKNIGARKT